MVPEANDQRQGAAIRSICRRVTDDGLGQGVNTRIAIYLAPFAQNAWPCAVTGSLMRLALQPSQSWL